MDAPDNESLRTIEQVSDHSELSAIYRRPGTQWDGEIVSAEERERRRKHHEETMSFGIRSKFWVVGILAPLPIIIFALLGSAALAYITEKNVSYFIIPGLIVFSLFIAFTISAIRKVFDLFYKNALRAGPFLFVLFTVLLLSIQILYILATPLHHQEILRAITYVGLAELVWSTVICSVLLILWTTPKISGGGKFGIFALLAIALLMANAAIMVLS